MYRYAKRAYFIVDKTGTVKFVKVMDNPLNLLDPEEVLKATKEARLADPSVSPSSWRPRAADRRQRGGRPRLRAASRFSPISPRSRPPPSPCPSLDGRTVARSKTSAARSYLLFFWATW